jgi:hypothetical protein
MEMKKDRIALVAAVLSALLPALAVAAGGSDSGTPCAPNTGAIYVVFNGQPVGTTAASVCPGYWDRSPASSAEFERLFQKDLDQIASSLPVRELEIVDFECMANAALIKWAPNSPRLSDRIKLALLALPYVDFLTPGLAGEPDGARALSQGAVSGALGCDGVVSLRAASSWGAIKILYR